MSRKIITNAEIRTVKRQCVSVEAVEKFTQTVAPATNAITSANMEKLDDTIYMFFDPKFIGKNYSLVLTVAMTNVVVNEKIEPTRTEVIKLPSGDEITIYCTTAYDYLVRTYDEFKADVSPGCKTYIQTPNHHVTLYNPYTNVDMPGVSASYNPHEIVACSTFLSCGLPEPYHRITLAPRLDVNHNWSGNPAWSDHQASAGCWSITGLAKQQYSVNYFLSLKTLSWLLDPGKTITYRVHNCGKFPKLIWQEQDNDCHKTECPYVRVYNPSHHMNSLIPIGKNEKMVGF